MDGKLRKEPYHIQMPSWQTKEFGMDVFVLDAGLVGATIVASLLATTIEKLDPQTAAMLDQDSSFFCSSVSEIAAESPLGGEYKFSFLAWRDDDVVYSYDHCEFFTGEKR